MPRITFHPLTPDRWNDFETLFGKNGACGGCWCMSWRLSAKDFKQKQGDVNRRAMKRIVANEIPPGILAYDGNEAVGWIALSPREIFIRLEKSRVLAPVDTQPVWSVSCFFVRKDHRKQGLTVELLQAAAKVAKRNKAKILEGYPQELTQVLSPPFVWTGLASAFRAAGFEEVARRSATRPIMRLYL
ncbi:MAG TPA: GNAT family N-acetyltransferase [Terriglobales bacterium]|nr:GNAT family N-acetyltransferase [Terriglobales bacterium]